MKQQNNGLTILSVGENEAISRQTDTICLLIENHIDSLRSCALGKKGHLNGVSFELLQKGRNAVYRVTAKENIWFLKVVCSEHRKGIEGEIIGYEFIRDNFRTLGYYLHPEAVRASLDAGYILVSEIPGQQINYHLYRTCFHPLASGFDMLRENFHRCGIILGHFHKSGQYFDSRNLKSGLANTLQRRLTRVKKHDKMSEQIAAWYEASDSFETELSIVHGNCTFRNIFSHQEKVALLDFETIGRGSRYNDLSRVCSDILLTRVALFFPWKRALKLLGDFLTGYRSVYPYDTEMLTRYISLYIFDRYVQVYRIKNSKETVSGIPYASGKYQWLLTQLLANNGSALLPAAAV